MEDNKPQVKLFDATITVAQLIGIIVVLGGAVSAFVTVMTTLTEIRAEQSAHIQEFKEFKEDTKDELKRLQP